MSSSTAKSFSPEPNPESKGPRLAPVEPAERKRSWLWLAVVIAMAAGGAWYYQHSNVAKQVVATAPTRSSRVVSGVLERTLRITGVTLADRTANMRAPTMTGRRTGGGGITDFGLILLQISPQGSRVKKGDILASFDPLSMATRLDDYKALREQHEKSVEVLRSNWNVTREAQRQRIKAAKGKMDKAKLDMNTAPVRSVIKNENLRLAFEEAKTQYDALLEQSKFLEASEMSSIRYTELDLKEAQIEERRAQANLDGMVARSPVDGLALASEIFRGSENSQITAGDQLSPGQLFMRVDDPSSIVVEASANQTDVQDLRLGARAQVMFDAYPGLQLPARLYSIDPITSSGRYRPYFVKKVRVRLRLEKSDPRVISDLTVNADVVLEAEKSNAIVPLEAVSEDARDHKAYAYVEEGGSWKRRQVELGVRNNISVAVTAGLEEGMSVATGPVVEIH
jgi:HlyD family secretion protein